MDITNILLVISAILFLIVIWSTTGIRHFYHLGNLIDKQWNRVNNNLRKRHDLIPNLIETMRNYKSDSEDISKSLIKARIKAIKDYCPCMNKVIYEHEISTLINKIVFLSIVVPSLRKDTNFMELRTEIDGIENKINMETNKYNELIRKYNRHRNKWYLKPISYVFGFDLEKIFEFEM
ncbi:hypothetical protein GF354_04100 [Candidatus Peregrinibacteria bacterium]|nr:hypothetical protein [Candidatus Peregrinibacteria bacterium]